MPGIGELVRERRLHLKMTQTELAQPEFSKSYVSYIESGKREPSTEALQTLAQKLKVPISYFLGDAVSDAQQQFNTLVNNARSLVEAGDLDATKILLDDAWALKAGIADPISLSRYYGVLAAWHEKRGDYYLALHQLLTAVHQLTDRPEQAWWLYYRAGIILHRLNQLDEAQRNYEQALICLSNSPEVKNRLAMVYYALALVFYHRKNYTAATSMFEQASKHSSSPQDQIRALAGLSATFEQLGDYEQAYQYSAKGVALAEQHCEQYLQAHTKLHLGVTLIGLKQFDRAADILKQGEQEAMLLQNRPLHTQFRKAAAQLLIESGQADKAILLLRSLIADLESNSLVETRKYLIQAKLLLAELLRGNDPESALQVAREAGEFAAETKHYHQAIKSYTLISGIYEQLGDAGQALCAARLALSFVNSNSGGNKSGSN